jgi:signal transduction histidine kinase
VRPAPWLRSRPEWFWDTLGAVVFAAISLIPALSQYGLALGELATRQSDAWHVALILLETLPLAARRLAPGWVLAVVGAAFFADQALGYPPSPAGLGLLVALYSAGAHLSRRRWLAVAIGALAYVALAVVLTQAGSRERPWEFATFALVLVAAWAGGSAVRLSAAASLSRAERAARDAALEERDRIARDLHDVVSHHVTSMVVQADSAAFLLPADETTVRGQLASIADGGRRALTDLRQLLEVLGPDGPVTTPAIGDLNDLAEEARRAGQHVDVFEIGQPHGTDELRLAVYRIVQEGLTNAVKHAPGARTEVAVAWAPADVRVRVTTARIKTARPDADSPRAAAPPGSGRGIAGLAERVRRLDGILTAGDDPLGGFVLEATIPVEPRGAQ